MAAAPGLPGQPQGTTQELAQPDASSICLAAAAIMGVRCNAARALVAPADALPAPLLLLLHLFIPHAAPSTSTTRTMVTPMCTTLLATTTIPEATATRPPATTTHLMPTTTTRATKARARAHVRHVRRTSPLMRLTSSRDREGWCSRVVADVVAATVRPVQWM